MLLENYHKITLWVFLFPVYLERFLNLHFLEMDYVSSCMRWIYCIYWENSHRKLIEDSSDVPIYLLLLMFSSSLIEFSDKKSADRIETVILIHLQALNPKIDLFQHSPQFYHVHWKWWHPRLVKTYLIHSVYKKCQLNTQAFVAKEHRIYKKTNETDDQ